MGAAWVNWWLPLVERVALATVALGSALLAIYILRGVAA